MFLFLLVWPWIVARHDILCSSTQSTRYIQFDPDTWTPTSHVQPCCLWNGCFKDRDQVCNHLQSVAEGSSRLIGGKHSANSCSLAWTGCRSHQSEWVVVNEGTQVFWFPAGCILVILLGRLLSSNVTVKCECLSIYTAGMWLSPIYGS